MLGGSVVGGIAEAKLVFIIFSPAVEIISSGNSTGSVMSRFDMPKLMASCHSHRGGYGAICGAAIAKGTIS